MKKIGILTYHRSINYGAMLQAYALRYTIQKLGYKVEVIDYGKIGQEKIFFLVNLFTKSYNWFNYK